MCVHPHTIYTDSCQKKQVSGGTHGGPEKDQQLSTVKRSKLANCIQTNKWGMQTNAETHSACLPGRWDEQEAGKQV